MPGTTDSQTLFGIIEAYAAENGYKILGFDDTNKSDCRYIRDAVGEPAKLKWQNRRNIVISMEAIDTPPGVINRVAGEFAVESDDIVTAIKKVGGDFGTVSGEPLPDRLVLIADNRGVEELIASVKESSRKLADSVRDILSATIAKAQIDGARKVFGLTTSPIIRELRDSAFYREVREELTTDELSLFETQYVKLVEEFQVDKLTPFEFLQIVDYSLADVRVKRYQKEVAELNHLHINAKLNCLIEDTEALKDKLLESLKTTRQRRLDKVDAALKALQEVSH